MATTEAISGPRTAKLCGECGVDRGFYRKQIRRLREKLEYAELKNLKLSYECGRLRKELSEAEFRGRSRSAHHTIGTDFHGIHCDLVYRDVLLRYFQPNCFMRYSRLLLIWKEN
jgi:hypothetical protein